VWFQLGNAQFRLGERQAVEAPEEARVVAPQCRAGRAALSVNRGTTATRHNLALTERRWPNCCTGSGLESFETSGASAQDEALVLSLRRASFDGSGL